MASVSVLAAHVSVSEVLARDGGLEDWPWSRGWPRELINMASVSVLATAAHVSVSVLEVWQGMEVSETGLGLEVGLKT